MNTPRYYLMDSLLSAFEHFMEFAYYKCFIIYYLSLGKESPFIFAKFNPLSTDTSLILALMVDPLSVLINPLSPKGD